MKCPDRIDGELAWGYWLTLERTARGDRLFDEDGTEWPSIREAFWRGRLHGPAPDDAPSRSRMDHALETMLATLIALKKGRSPRDPAFVDAFAGGAPHAELFLLWIETLGLAVGGVVTEEGGAVANMLFATRPTGLRAVRPGRASLAALLLPAPPEAGRSARRAQIEDEAVRMDLAFLRRDVAGNPGIVARRRQRKPTLDVVTVDRIVWSVDFDDATARNDLFDWLADRIDRWEDWIELAYASGADRLTRRLLSMVVIVERRTRLLAHLG